jgi:hypothetical protein
MSYLWRVPHTLDGARLAERIGPLAATAPREAIRQALLDLGFGAAVVPSNAEFLQPADTGRTPR